MAAKKRSVRAVPKGYSTVTATLNQSDAKATIAFLKKAFGAKVLTKMTGPGGKLVHCELQLGDSRLMISDAVREPARVASLFLYVPDVDKTVAKAIKAGAKIMMPVADMFWGDRYGRIVDPFGNTYAVATHVENVKPADMKKREKAFAKQMAAG